MRVEYLGSLVTSDVAACFARHGLFFFPTANENFGFVILEALLAGCPVLLSEHTPWRDLARPGVGWDLPLSQPDLMRAALRKLVEMDSETHGAMSQRAREFALDFMARDKSTDRNSAMFESALAV